MAHLNSSPMIALAHQGESSVHNLHISYIENAYFKFGGTRGCLVSLGLKNFQQLQLSYF